MTKKAAFILVFPFVMWISSCRDPILEKRNAEEEIRAVVLRKQIDDWFGPIEASLAHPKDSYESDATRSLNFHEIYISVGETDPSDQLLLRLQVPGRTVRKLSASTGRPAPRDKISHKLGILFVVGSVKWLTDHSAEVYGQYWCGGLCSAEYQHTLRLKDGHWTVESSKMLWIS